MQLLIGSVAVLAFAITVGYVILNARSLEQEGALARAHDIAARYGAEVSASFNGLTADSRGLAQTLGALADAGASADPGQVATLATAILEDRPEALGVWVYAAGGDPLPTVAVSRGDKGPVSLKLAAGVAAPAADGWVAQAVKKGREAICEPRRESSEGGELLYVRLLTPIRSNGQVTGAVGIDISLMHYVEILKGVKQQLASVGTGYMSIVSNGAHYVAHPTKPERIANPVIDTDPWSEPFLKQLAAGEPWDTESFSRSEQAFPSASACRCRSATQVPRGLSGSRSRWTSSS